MPSLHLRPAPSPLDVPALELEPTFAIWPPDELERFTFEHADVALLVKHGKMGKRELREHLARIPQNVRANLGAALRLSAALPPNVLCERIDAVVADAHAFWVIASS